MALNTAITAAYIVNFAWRKDTSGTDQAAVGWGPLALSLVSFVALAVSGYLGGMLAYRYGVRVAGESVQADGYRKHSAG